MNDPRYDFIISLIGEERFKRMCERALEVGGDDWGAVEREAVRQAKEFIETGVSNDAIRRH